MNRGRPHDEHILVEAGSVNDVDTEPPDDEAHEQHASRYNDPQQPKSE